jgi:hypothetical protein
MRIEFVKRILRKLTLTQLRQLNVWIHDQLIMFNEEIKPEVCGREYNKSTKRLTNNKTYRLEGVCCGKKGCKCADGHLHGPYWYAYWTEGGRTRSEYVGKKLPRGVRKA